MKAIIRRCFLMTDEQGGVTELTTNDLTLPWPTSAFEHFSFQRFLHLRNPQKPAETNQNQETRKFGNLCPNSQKPVFHLS
ncbi:hypothetical protein K443DRAFT_466232 [Laccaria amethystina LaAM-08-1]|uniref:Uncharacterized protein n=1 Tax=Laccaria amethystina LaAM-08-1 TaxID=1095629 RepID=A0A0C9XQ63_9AGAR|nr:hypothetical protein K443DRAFT_466232 [Laccaria amethystina LaAM-08-1]